jgi:hypothetical protein
LWEGSADSDTSLNKLQIAALTLTLSRREKELTVVFGRYAPTCNTEPNSDFEALKQEPLTLALPKRRTARRERELTVVFGRYTPTCNTEPNSDFEALKQEPLTLALPKRRTARRERELTVVFGRYTPTCDTPLNSDFEMPKNRLPLPRERAGVRGESNTEPKPTTRSSPLNRPSVSSPALDLDPPATSEG